MIKIGFKYVADSNQTCFQFESGTYAVASGARQWCGLVQDNAPTEDVGVTPIRYQGAYSRGVSVFTNGPLKLGGTLNYYPQDWKLLGFAVGSVCVQSLAGSKMIRESNSTDANYSIPSQSLASFTLEDSKKTANLGSNFIRTYNGCMVDTFKLTMAEGEIANVELGYVAQNVTYSSGTVTSVTARTTVPYIWSDIAIHLPSGTKLPNCTEFSLNINNNLESRFPLNGSRTIETAIPLNRDYEVTATFLMDTLNAGSLYNNYFINGNQFNAMAEIKATAGSAYIVMSGCKITAMDVPSPVEGLHEQTATITPTNISVDVFDAIGSYNGW